VGGSMVPRMVAATGSLPTLWYLDMTTMEVLPEVHQEVVLVLPTYLHLSPLDVYTKGYGCRYLCIAIYIATQKWSISDPKGDPKRGHLGPILRVPNPTRNRETIKYGFANPYLGVLEASPEGTLGGYSGG